MWTLCRWIELSSFASVLCCFHLKLNSQDERNHRESNDGKYNSCRFQVCVIKSVSSLYTSDKTLKQVKKSCSWLWLVYVESTKTKSNVTINYACRNVLSSFTFLGNHTRNNFFRVCFAGVCLK